mmetsp:Transcript_11342/g.26143  ORF Transcript_11342/g.26143 Transcript_11342/m.26143 type:complete len:511 (+) Transcript_11342:87-1619(+)|eukprot:CAMPEP_0178407590 /NCGR_PEP_ID=MMETSP0689_2-20121128/19506_1 /TAXON_ID=160604 /ORGANISM="Amphidinium massartii, Strain CS-259" /LENGTH=510 /DNA_ID=CAMNT_0020028667 /DNA_START=23 /DNA_END=1555 /DNA_ORIENTATION=-
MVLAIFLPWLLGVLVAALLPQALALRPVSDADEASFSVEHLHANATSGSVLEAVEQLPPRGPFLYMASGEGQNEDYFVDGMLSAAGEEQVKKRMAQMKMSSTQTYNFLKEVKEILVAPRASAITTALMVVAMVWGDLEMREVPLPKFRIIPNMRQRAGWIVPTAMQETTARKDFGEFAHKVCSEYIARDQETFLDASLEDIIQGYMQFIKQDHKRVHGAGNALMLHHHVHEVKQELFWTNKPAFVVGDCEFGTFMFMAGLPSKKPPPADDSELWARQNLRNLFRDVQSLTHASVIKAEWMVSTWTEGHHLQKNLVNRQYTVPYLKSVDPLAEELSASKLPNLDQKGGYNVPYDDVSFVHTELLLVKPPGAAQHFPKNAYWLTHLLHKRKYRTIRKTYSDDQLRIMNVAVELNPFGPHGSYRGWITWSTPWGRASKGLLDLNEARLEQIESGPLMGALKLATGTKNAHWILTGDSTQLSGFYNSVTGMQKLLREGPPGGVLTDEESVDEDD